MSEGSTTGQKQCEQILSKLAESKFNTLAIVDPLTPPLEWALLRLNHLFLVFSPRWVRCLETKEIVKHSCLSLQCPLVQLIGAPQIVLSEKFCYQLKVETAIACCKFYHQVHMPNSYSTLKRWVRLKIGTAMFVSQHCAVNIISSAQGWSWKFKKGLSLSRVEDPAINVVEALGQSFPAARMT